MTASSLSQQTIYSYTTKADVQSVPNHQVNYLNPKAVQSRKLSKEQYRHLSDRSLLKLVDGSKVEHLDPKFIAGGQIGIKACRWLKDNRSELWHRLPDDAKMAAINFEPTGKNAGRINPSDFEKNSYRDFFDRECTHSTHKFKLSGKTRSVVSYSDGSRGPGARKALFFTALPITDYNHAYYEKKSDHFNVAFKRHVATIGRQFDFKHYQVGTVSEIVEICSDPDLRGKVELIVISGHSNRDCINLSEDPKKKSAYPELVLGINQTYKNSAKKIYRPMKDILTKNSFVILNGCNTGKLKEKMCIAKKFSNSLRSPSERDRKTTVIGFKSKSFNTHLAITSLSPGKISYSMAARKDSKPVETVVFYQTKTIT